MLKKILSVVGALMLLVNAVYQVLRIVETFTFYRDELVKDSNREGYDQGYKIGKSQGECNGLHTAYTACLYTNCKSVEDCQVKIKKYLEDAELKRDVILG